MSPENTLASFGIAASSNVESEWFAALYNRGSKSVIACVNGFAAYGLAFTCVSMARKDSNF